jgi:1,4-alpha-glucan branching enzyme
MSTSPKGLLAITLHAHLPYVRHPDTNDFLEGNWLNEAITETYIPLLDIFEDLVSEGVRFRITVSLSPPLMAMLSDSLLQQRYVDHIDRLIELGEKEVRRTASDPQVHPLAIMYRDRLYHAKEVFERKYDRNLLNGFRSLRDAGVVELITSAATHGFLPLMAPIEESISAQVAVGVATYRQHFGSDPVGFWLPECGYSPGVDTALARHGIRYTYTDTHGVLFASPRPKYGVYAPIYCQSGVAVFGRDVESSKQVWSADEGYPGDFDYRDFYRDIGFDLDYEYVRPYLQNGIRAHTGIKYHRVTGRTDDKAIYNRQAALNKAALHAANFMFNRERQIEYLASILDRQPVVVAPYDAELFGHWWFEGPEWLYHLIRKSTSEQSVYQLATLSDYLEKYPDNQVSTPSMSSWGYKGYCEVWLNEKNDWIYRHLHRAARLMVELADRYRDAEGLLRRALNQAARELLLAQSSDWAFIMKTGTMVDYAIRRTRNHIGRFTELYDQITQNRIDPSYLAHLEWKDNIFGEIDYSVYASQLAV